jgi:uncharacterized protein YlxW (UPF0749 family)
MEDLITIDTIVNWLLMMVQTKQPVHAATWLDASQKIVVLLQDEQEKLFELDQEVAKARNLSLESGESVARAKSRVEELDIYKEARKQKAKIERAIELIRISKLQSRMASDVMSAH